MSPQAAPLHKHEHDAEQFVGAVEGACARRDLRLTPLRRDVLELLAESKAPVKAYQLLDLLRARHPNAAPPTVYRALDFMLDNGFIHKLESISSYISCPHPAVEHQVPFLICDNCASAVEVCDPRVAELIEAQASALGFHAHGHTLEVHGICAACAAARNQA